MFDVLYTDVAMPAAAGASEALVLRLLIQLIAIICVSRLVVLIVRKFLQQTDVSGEILAGLLLGPSLLGAFFPDVMNRLFDPSTATAFTALSQLGLIFLMFQVGLEFEFKHTFDTKKTTMFAVSAVGIVVPFALGYITAPWFLARLPLPHPSAFGFQLFFAVAMSITAIPILGRIFLELGLSHTRIAALVLGAAALDDVAGWLILSVVAAIVGSNFSVEVLLLRIGALIGYTVLIFLVVRPLFKRWLARHLDTHGSLQPSALAYVIVLLFGSAIFTSLIGVFAIIGGFFLGVALHDDRRFVAEWRTRITPIVNTLFLPIFFTYTGLRTNVGMLGSPALWVLCGLVILVAFVGKFGGAYVAARLTGESHRDATTIGICMNTRALMELVALNIGYDLGVLPQSMFTMLVIMAIASTFITTPIIRRLMRGEERQETQARVAPALNI